MNEADPRQTLVSSLAKLAEDCGVGKAFDDEIIKAKRNEALALNRAGIRRQIEFLVSSYPLAMTERAVDEIEGIILDNAQRGKTVSCSVCGGVEFEAKARVKGTQQFICRHCAKTM